MADYTMTQVFNDTTVTSVDLTVTAIPYSAEDIDDSIDKMQQLVIHQNNWASFTPTYCYWIKIKIPQNKNYDLNYGIRLMNLGQNPIAQNLKNDSSNYTFIKYFSIPRVNLNNIDVSTVWFYTIDGGINVDAAVALPIGNKSNDPENNTYKVFYGVNNNNNNFYIGNNTTTYTIGVDGVDRNSIIMANNFGSTKDNNGYHEFLIPPVTSPYNAIYLYLKPNEVDRDLRWQDGNITMMGRHIEDLSSITIEGGRLSDNIVDANKEIVNIGIWGRSGQLMAINGQEMVIGPSGYYELKNYNIDSLYIANTAEGDKYTVDIQYVK